MPTQVEKERDYYLVHPPRQPKKEIGDYIARQGLPVPHRFSDLSEAVASGKPFIVRSEHPQDYSGASGLGYSLFVRPEDFLEDKEMYHPPGDEEERKFFQINHYNWAVVRHFMERLAVNTNDLSQTEVEKWLTILSFYATRGYCQYTGLDVEQFNAGRSYSYWEGLGGFNRAVIADNTVPHKYFVFTSLLTPKRGVMLPKAEGYHVIEAGRIVDARTGQLPEEASSDLDSLIEFYESVRNLNRFDSNHCPLVEAQTVDGRHYCLQYLRIRDFYPSTFVLDRGIREGEYAAVFVRGATPPEGLDLTVNIREKPSGTEEIEEAGYEVGYEIRQTPWLIEALAPRRKLQLFGVGSHHSLLSAGGHLIRSSLLKPEISAVMEQGAINSLFGGVGRPMVKRSRIHVVSDGRKLYLSLV